MTPTPISVYNTRRSSTVSIDPLSPDSPGIGRIAKSNARLLNGLDINSGKKAGSYLDTTVVLPELKTLELSDKCPTLSKIINEGKKALTIEQLPAIQFELEELISQNVDYQKTINGEITYLTTGEYPTIDLQNRPMPSYEKIRTDEFKKINDRAKQAEATPNTSLADLGILSSPEDDEPPHILDVPHRFWTWSKSYLHHISLDYVKEFKAKLVDRFSEENILQKYCQPVIKKEQQSSPKRAQMKRKHPSLLEQSKQISPDTSRTTMKTPTKRAKFNSKSPPQQQQLSSNAVLLNSVRVMNQKLLIVSTPKQNGKIEAREQPTMNGNTNNSLDGLINGVDSFSSASPKKNKTNVRSPTTKNMAKNNNNNKIPFRRSVKAVVVTETPKLVRQQESEESEDDIEQDGINKEWKQEVDDEEMEEDADETLTLKKEPNNDDNKDEVTLELNKKQARLRELYTKCRPTIDELYGRMLKEYAVYEAFRELDEADNKLFQIASKSERLHRGVFANKEQRQEAKAAITEHREAYAKFGHSSVFSVTGASPPAATKVSKTTSKKTTGHQHK